MHSCTGKGIPTNIFGGDHYIIYMIILHGNILYNKQEHKDNTIFPCPDDFLSFRFFAKDDMSSHMTLISLCQHIMTK